MTLLELIVVIIIIALLTGLLTPVATTYIKQAKIKATKDGLDELGEALLAYYRDTGTFPADSGNVLNDLYKLEYDTISGWNGPYIAPQRKAKDYCYDAWNNLLVYDYTSGSLTCTITSYGPNKTSGGGDDIVYTVNANIVLKKKIQTTYNELQRITKALEEFLKHGYRITGTFNTSDSFFNYFLGDSKLKTDEWGNYYYWDSAKKTFYSYGPDGSPGGGDDIYPPGMP